MAKCHVKEASGLPCRAETNTYCYKCGEPACGRHRKTIRAFMQENPYAAAVQEFRELQTLANKQICATCEASMTRSLQAMQALDE